MHDFSLFCYSGEIFLSSLQTNLLVLTFFRLSVKHFRHFVEFIRVKTAKLPYRCLETRLRLYIGAKYNLVSAIIQRI